MWSDTESSTNPRTDTNVTTNITATASFTANENTVVFNGNGDTVGATADQKMHTADVANLTANGYTMTGYTFAGWNTLANGSGTAYADTASYTMGTDASVTLYAQWISDADIAAVAGAKSAISGGTYTNLVVTDSADQAIKTAAVQAKVNLYKGTTTATVTWADPNYNVAISQGGASDSYTITTATFLQTINIADIDGVTPPVAGATPVTTITESSQYTGSVTWTPNDVKFASITEYTARIALTAKAGYTFIGVSASYFTVDGSSNTFNSANSGVVNAVFPTTDQLAEGSAVANDGTKVITYVLATGTFDHTAGEVVGNWVLDGTSHGGIEPIVSVVLSGDHETATITVTSDIVAVGNYTIAPAQAAFSAGFTAPAAVTVYIPA